MNSHRRRPESERNGLARVILAFLGLLGFVLGSGVGAPAASGGISLRTPQSAPAAVQHASTRRGESRTEVRVQRGATAEAGARHGASAHTEADASASQAWQLHQLDDGAIVTGQAGSEISAKIAAGPESERHEQTQARGPAQGRAPPFSTGI